MNHILPFCEILSYVSLRIYLFWSVGQNFKNHVEKFSFIYLPKYIIFVIVLCMRVQMIIRLARVQPQGFGKPALCAGLFLTKLYGCLEQHNYSVQIATSQAYLSLPFFSILSMFVSLKGVTYHSTYFISVFQSSLDTLFLTILTISFQPN